MTRVESLRHLVRFCCYLAVLAQLGFIAWALERPRGNGARLALRLVVWPVLFLITVLAVVAGLRAAGVDMVDLIIIPLLVMIEALRRLRRWMAERRV